MDNGLDAIVTKEVADLILSLKKRVEKLEARGVVPGGGGAHAHDSTYAALVHQTRHQSGGSDALSGNLDAIARTRFENNGVLVGSRRTLNFIPGVNITLLIVDDPANEEVDLTISASGGGAGTDIDVKLNGVLVGTQSAINLIEGTNVNMTVTNDTGTGEIDILVSATAGSVDIDALAAVVEAAAADLTIISVGGAEKKITLPNFLRGKWDRLVIKASNSRNPSFGDLNCNGTGDQNEFNTAFADLDVGGVLAMSEGEFSFSGPAICGQDNVSLIGQGAGAGDGYSYGGTAMGSRIIAASGFVGTEILRFADESVSGDKRPRYGIWLAHFSIDGKDIGSNIDGLLLKSHRHFLEHVHIRNCSGNGFHYRGYGPDERPSADNDWDLYDSTTRDCQAEGNSGGAGFFIDTHAPDMHFYGIMAYNQNMYGFRVRSGSQQFVGMHTYDNDLHGGWFDSAGGRTKINNWKCEGNGGHGLFIDNAGGTGPGDIQVNASNFRSNSRDNEDAHSGIRIGGSAGASVNRTLLTSINLDNASGFGRYGIDLSTGATDTVIGDYTTTGSWVSPNNPNGDPIRRGSPQVRTLIRGSGVNSGNPSSSGNWNGYGREGIIVKDTTSGIKYIYINGAWETL